MKCFFRKSKKKTNIITAAMISSVAFLFMSANIGSDMTSEFEGMVLKNYIDSVGVETWCIGETQVGRLEEGYTKEYCQTLFKQRFNQYSGSLYECYDDEMKKYVTPAMHAAFTDVYFNAGARCETGMMRRLKEKQPVKACEYILKYKFAGGRDCSKRYNDCYGVWIRREKTSKLCLSDATQLEEEISGNR